MLAYITPILGQCSPILGLSWADVEVSWGLCWGILGLCWGIVRDISAKTYVECYRAKKDCKLQGILSIRIPHRWPLGWSMLAYFAGNVGSAWTYVDPTWGYVGLFWRLCGPILRLLSTDLEAYVGPCWPVRNQKMRKMGRAKKHRIFWGSAAYVGGLYWNILVYVGRSWGLYCIGLRLLEPILELCWPILGPCWSFLEVILAYLGSMFGLLDTYLGLCSPILSHKLRKRRKNAKNTKHRKTRLILAAGGVGGRGPLSPTERGETSSARRPWPDFSLYTRQPARGPTMWAHVMARLAYVGLRFMLSQKIRKMGTVKNTVKRRRFWWSASYLGAILAHLGAMLAYLEGNVGPSWGYIGPSWGYFGPSWGYVGPF